MADGAKKNIKGRGAQSRPANRYERVRLDRAVDAVADRSPDEPPAIDRQTRRPLADAPPRLATQFLPDQTRSIISENNSPDVGFRFSVNPYRGCEHGCAYCYARPTHEYLGFDAGLDFESKIMVKHRAPELLREALAKKSWQGELIAFSGNTDCYQPAERQYELTRGCLAVCAQARQAVGIITKNALLLRDLDLLTELARERLVHVNMSVTTLDANLARAMEPRTSSPAARLDAIAQLAAAGVPVRVMVAPIIPGLTDLETPAILAAASQAGARSAGYVLLRLPLTVEPVFRDWLVRNCPEKQERIESLVQATRGGEYYRSEWGQRMKGGGAYAEGIGRQFAVFAKKHGLDGKLTPAIDTTKFRRPRLSGDQLPLFD